MNYPVCKTCKNRNKKDHNLCYGCGISASMHGTFCNYKKDGRKYTEKEYNLSFKE